MRPIYFTIVLFIIFIAFLNSCSKESTDCNCFELTTKNIKYIDSDNNNILFGEHAIYNPDSIKIKVGADDYIRVFNQEELGTIMFNLFRYYSTYQIFLSDSIIDTLSFDLAERKSTLCGCGNVTYSIKTYLNSEEIENEDLIIIIQ